MNKKSIACLFVLFLLMWLMCLNIFAENYECLEIYRNGDNWSDTNAEINLLDDDPDESEDSEIQEIIVDNAYLENLARTEGFVRISPEGINNSFARKSSYGTPPTMALVTDVAKGFIEYYPNVSKSGLYEVYACWPGQPYSSTNPLNTQVKFTYFSDTKSESVIMHQTLENANRWKQVDGENINELGEIIWNKIGTFNFYSNSNKEYITATGLTNNARFDALKFVYAGPAELEAFDVKIIKEGQDPEHELETISYGEKLIGSYRLNHVDVIDRSEFLWELTDEKDGIYYPIRYATDKEYTPSIKDVGKYVRFSVKAKTDKHSSLSWFKSQSVKIIDPDMDENISKTYQIKDVDISGRVMANNTITVDVDYSGEKDEIKKLIYSVFIADNIGDNGEKITEDLELEADEKFTYELTEEYTDKYIYVEVQPVTYLDSDVIYGKKVGSKKYIIRAETASYITDVYISYNQPLNKQSILVGNYTFNNIYGDIDDSIYKWYVSSTGSSNFTEIKGENKKSLSLNGRYEGQYILFEVIPKSDMEEKFGDAIRSNSVYIAPQSSSKNYYGGRGGSSGGTGIIKSNHETENGISDKLDATSSVKFKDIDNSYAKTSIENMVKRGIIKGVSDNLFEPQRFVTRAEFITIVIRALNTELVPYENFFNDVNEYDWFAKEVTTAKLLNLISGNGLDFNPNSFITREEMTKIIVEAYKTKNASIPSVELNFKDFSEISDWAVSYVENAVVLELIKGVNDNYFDPKSNTTREQAAIIVERLISKL